jgi:putative addiction module component (TIGR02574 family)
MTKDNIIAEILKLSQSEKIRIAQDIWDIVAQVPEATILTKEQEYELDRRLSEVEANPSIGIDWQAALEEIKSTK